ncbi:Lrp/AsnC family transcriptional regulator [Candidatus Micrarchaeota archaeon]|nr:Lrp/AsnC family transcriptional regulator [Candidatus Micrarchaeota archaeon]
MKIGHFEIDETDERILDELKKDSRKSLRKLSSSVGVSPSAISERLRRMERAGVIKGYTASLDLSKLGYEFVAIIQISISGGALLDVQKKISGLPGVVAVYDVTGQYDSTAILMRKSRSELSSLIKKILAIPHVEKTNTSMVLNVVKDFTDSAGI